MAKKGQSRVATGGLKSTRYPNAKGANPPGVRYREVLDGILYVEHRQYQQFKAELQLLCAQFDYKFSPAEYKD
jgi:hypothetical protein